MGLWLEGQKYFQSSIKEGPIINDQDKNTPRNQKLVGDVILKEKPDIKRLSLKPRSLLDKSVETSFVRNTLW